MKLRILSAALATAGLLGFASQAAASGFILTFQGVVSTGSDDTNIFGLGSGASLVGQGISESFVVDYAGGDYRLSAASPYRNAATDGTDLGADIATIAPELAALSLIDLQPTV